jgi:hypothetical protein
LPSRLTVLDVLLAKQSVSETARRLGLTQSATSHTLKGLRRHCGDAIAVRIGDRNAANIPSISMSTAIATKVYGRAEAIRPEPGDEFDERVIAGSIWPKQCDNLPRRDRRLRWVDREHAGEGLREFRYLDWGAVGGCSGGCRSRKPTEAVTSRMGFAERYW